MTFTRCKYTGRYEAINANNAALHISPTYARASKSGVTNRVLYWLGYVNNRRIVKGSLSDCKKTLRGI